MDEHALGPSRECVNPFIDLIDEKTEKLIMYTQLLAEFSFLIFHINVSQTFALVFLRMRCV